jgi:glycine dehydrogenase subunit 1
MPYLYNTPGDQQAMLQAIGARDLNELFSLIPAEMRLQRPLDLPPAMTEIMPATKFVF